MGTVLTRQGIGVTNRVHWGSKHQALAVICLTQTAKHTWISSSDSHTRCPYSLLCATAPLLSAVSQTPRSQTLVKMRHDPLLPVSLAHWHNLPVDYQNVKMIGKRMDDTSSRCLRGKNKKNTENTEWIHSANYDITRRTCANNRPLSLDLRLFVQNHTEALCSQTALETALMFIQITNKCSIMVNLISSLILTDERYLIFKQTLHSLHKCRFCTVCLNTA